MPETAVHREDTERLFTGYSGRLSVAVAVGWMAALLGRDVLPPLLPVIVEDLSITPSRAGLALTVMFAVYSLAQFPGGRLSDRLSRRTVLVGGLGVSIVGFGLLVVSPSYGAFMVALAFVGAGAGAYLPATRGMLSDLFVARRGQVFGLQMSAGSLGSTMAAGVAVVALAVAGWRAAFLPSVVILAGVLLALHVWMREPYVVERVHLGVRDTGTRLFEMGNIRLLLVAYTLFSICWVGVMGFLPTFFQVEKGLSPALASAGFAGFYAMGMVVTPLAGKVSDRLRPTPVAAVAACLGAVGLAGIVFAPSLPLLAAATVVYSLAWSFPPVMQSYVMSAFPPESRAGDFGAMKSLYTLVASVGPTYVGFTAERASYVHAFGGFVPLLVLTAVVLVLLMSFERP